ncbi:2958_t:CDS:2 [Ambispora gerdemannii]|uniref:2958_t:CDS:1 n=1 Tax=Ambispora gerdemannii TaxID=144530 RepID=A0A9N8ZF82_9GLOM|nr:2958_t:CDS:2 [Ambispora gerdemannii]
MSSQLCFWSLLSQRDFTFVYISPFLSRELGLQHSSILGTSFFDYIHPLEKELARRDFFGFVNKKTLYGSVTRCQFNSISAIQYKLLRHQQQQFYPMIKTELNSTSTSTSSSFLSTGQYAFVHNNPENNHDTTRNISSTGSPSLTSQTQQIIKNNTEKEYVIMNIGMNVVSKDIVLACFHSDEAVNDNFNVNAGIRSSSYISSTCGESNFTSEELNNMFKILQRYHAHMESINAHSPPSTPSIHHPLYYPSIDRIFQIFDAQTKKLIFTWPDPNASSINQHKHSNFNSFLDYDFSRLIHNFDFTSNSLHDTTSPKCIRPYDNKHVTKLSSGDSRIIESVMIPHGKIIFACFQVMPPSSSINGNTSSSSEYLKPRPHSAPCSPATVPSICGNGNKRARGSLSPPIRLNSYENSKYFSIPDFTLDSDSEYRKRRATGHESPLFIKGSQSPVLEPNHLLHPISPQFPAKFSPQSNPLRLQIQPQQPSDYKISPISTSPTSPIRTYANTARGRNTNQLMNGTVKICESCQTSSSPEWRRGPTGHKTLCNACGLRYSRTIARENRKRQEREQREREERERDDREREERDSDRGNGALNHPFTQFIPGNSPTYPVHQFQQQSNCR